MVVAVQKEPSNKRHDITSSLTAKAKLQLRIRDNRVGRRGLGDDTPFVIDPAALYGGTAINPVPMSMDQPLIIPGSSAGSILWNAATGDLSNSQVANLTNQETASLIQAGMSPAQAAAAASSDVTTTLSTFVGPDGSVGALPSQSGLLPTLALGVPSWMWEIGIGLAAFWLLKEFKIIK
jgi:hypothetical protein